MLFIPFHAYDRGLGGPNTFMRNLRADLDEAEYPYTTDAGEGSAIFFPIAYDKKVVRHFAVRGLPIIQRLDGVYYPSKNGWQYWIRNLPIKKIYQQSADIVVFQSDYSRRQCFEMFGELPAEKFHIIANGVDCGLFRPDSAPVSLDAGVRFVTTGRFRGHDMLEPILRALDSLVGRFPFNLRVIGRVERSTLRPLLDRPWVECLGEMTLEKVALELRGCHVFLFSSLNSACPNAVLEATAAGLPVVAFDDGANPELLDFNKELLVRTPPRLYRRFEDLDAAKYARCIEACVGDYQRFRTRAVENTNRLSFAVCGAEYRRVFDQALGRGFPSSS